MSVARVLSAMRTFAFVYLTALAAVVFSERVFWFWSPRPVVHLELALFYSLPVAAVVWGIAWFRVSTPWALLVVTPLYAYITEGVITPVMYLGGPFVPFFPAWFAAWHGIGAVFVLWYCIRRWLVAGAWRQLAVLGAGLGVFWGIWASTQRLPGEVNDPDMVADLGELTVLGPGSFAAYAAYTTGLLIVAHVGVDRVWPSQFQVSKRSTRVMTVAMCASAAVWTVAAPWALPMFLAYGYVQVRFLRRHRSVSIGPNLIEQLAGRIELRYLAPLVLIAPFAALTYLVMWWLDPSELVLNAIYFGGVGLQTLIGGVASVVAWRRSGRSVRSTSYREGAVQGEAELARDRRALRMFRA